MIINEFSIIIVASKHLRVGWGEKEKGPTMMIALNYYHGNYATILTIRNTNIIMAESNILGIITHTVLISNMNSHPEYIIFDVNSFFRN